MKTLHHSDDGTLSFLKGHRMSAIRRNLRRQSSTSMSSIPCQNNNTNLEIDAKTKLVSNDYSVDGQICFLEDSPFRILKVRNSVFKAADLTTSYFMIQ